MAGALYFVLVFGAGFVLGPIRILWLVPQFGTRAAELMEVPVMLVVIVSAFCWISRRGPRATGMGLSALALFLAAELVLGVLGRSATTSSQSRPGFGNRVRQPCWACSPRCRCLSAGGEGSHRSPALPKHFWISVRPDP